jgi:hypothetical protein
MVRTGYTGRTCPPFSGGGTGVLMKLILAHRRLPVVFCLVFVVFAIGGSPVSAQESMGKPLVLAHYMPWYAAKPYSKAWGWHWTMNAFDLDKTTDGKPQIASHYRPLIGPYDSGDPAVLEYHLLLMKLAGIDGVIVDWYGLTDQFDYAELHRNTAALVKAAGKLGLQFAICYEDQTVPKLAAAKKLATGDRVKHVRGELDWLRKNWFAEPHYVRLGGKPLLLSFGFGGLTDKEWEEVLFGSTDHLVYVSEHRKRSAASGAFDWPIPKEYPEFLDRFENAAHDLKPAIPVAFPRFHDIYEQGKAGKSLGRIADDDGRTWTVTLARAFKGKPAVVQLATWNDWGEGTGIEPTEEFGYRDLEAVQEFGRTHLDAKFPFQGGDLRLPHRLLQQRRKANTVGQNVVLDEITQQIVKGNTRDAKSALDGLEEGRK